RARPCMWRPAGELPAVSPIEGAPNGLWLRAAGPRSVAADVALGAGPLPAGDYALHVKVEANGAPARFTLRAADGHESAIAAEPGSVAALDAMVHHDGGRLRMTARLEGAGANNASAWISDGALEKMKMAPGSAP